MANKTGNYADSVRGHSNSCYHRNTFMVARYVIGMGNRDIIWS